MNIKNSENGPYEKRYRKVPSYKLLSRMLFLEKPPLEGLQNTTKLTINMQSGSSSDLKEVRGLRQEFLILGTGGVERLLVAGS